MHTACTLTPHFLPGLSVKNPHVRTCPQFGGTSQLYIYVYYYRTFARECHIHSKTIQKIKRTSFGVMGTERVPTNNTQSRPNQLLFQDRLEDSPLQSPASTPRLPRPQPRRHRPAVRSLGALQGGWGFEALHPLASGCFLQQGEIIRSLPGRLSPKPCLHESSLGGRRAGVPLGSTATQQSLITCASDCAHRHSR